MVNYKNLEEFERIGCYLIKILFSILHNKKPPALPDGITWESVFTLAKMHSVEAMTFYGVKDHILQDKPLYNQWKKSRDANLGQSIMQLAEQMDIFHSLYEANIRFLPLKGYQFKRLYKKPEFRQMADIDLLVDPENLSKVRSILEKKGYMIRSGAMPHHEEYFKPPCVTIEIHKQLLLIDDTRQSYYDQIWQKAIPDKKIEGAWKLTPEDFYIYQIAHFEKHFNRMGSGIRSVMDIFVYLNTFNKKLDHVYIKNELQKLGIYEFCRQMETLSQYWFSENTENLECNINQLKELQRAVFLSGVYGSREFFSSRKIKYYKEKHTFLYKVLFWRDRIFMSKQEFKNSYPILQKYPILLPFFWVHRIVFSLLYKRDTIKREMELLQEKSKNK